MRPDEQPDAPSGPWRAASAFTMGAVGLLCKGFLGLNKVETHGMDDFLKLLDERKDIVGRDRGLITGMWPQGKGLIHMRALIAT
jgi:monolysocardiolipin acyltransferase